MEQDRTTASQADAIAILGQTPILQGVDMTVQRGEIVAPLAHPHRASVGRARGAAQVRAQDAPVSEASALGEIPPARAVARQAMQEDDRLQSASGLRGARSPRMSSMRAWIAPLMRGCVRM